MYRFVTVLITAFWLVMVSLLVKQEILATIVWQNQGQYRQLLQSERIVEPEIFGIYRNGQRIGRSETTYFPDEEEAYYMIDNRTEVNMQVFGKETQLALHGTAYINPAYKLDHFSCTLTSEFFTASAEGRIEAEEFIVKIKTSQGADFSSRYPVGRDVLISNGLSSYITVENLQIGKRWGVKYLNPITMRMQEVVAEVLRQETIEWEGEDVKTYVIQFEQKPLRSLVWVTPDGRPIKEHTPLFGVTLIREKLEEEAET